MPNSRELMSKISLDGAKMATTINLALCFMLFQVVPNYFWYYGYTSYATVWTLYGVFFAILGSVILHFGVSSSNNIILMVGLGVTGLAAINALGGMVKTMIDHGPVVKDHIMGMGVTYFLVYMVVQVLTLLLNVGVLLTMKQTPASIASEPTA